jgi:hypothetical protein
MLSRLIAAGLSMGLLIASSGLAQQNPQAKAPRVLVPSFPIGVGLMDDLPKFHLLLSPPVQEELKLTPGDVERIKAARAKSQVDQDRQAKEANKRALDYKNEQEALGLPRDPAVMRDMNQKANDDMQAAWDGLDASMVRVLTRPQRTRFEQIYLQAQGPMAFTSPEFQTRLNMSPEQIEAIGEIVTEGYREVRLLDTSSVPPEFSSKEYVNASRAERLELLKSKPFKDALEKRQVAGLAARRAVEQRVNRLLTKGQREKYRKMLGEPFNFQPSSSGSKPAAEKKAP